MMPESQLFNDENDLRSKLMKFKFMSAGAYRNIIESQWKWLNSPIKEGDFNLRNFWLEDNLNIWVDLMRLKQKTLNISISNVMAQIAARKAEEQKKQIAQSKSGEAIITL